MALKLDNSFRIVKDHVEPRIKVVEQIKMLSDFEYMTNNFTYQEIINKDSQKIQLKKDKMLNKFIDLKCKKAKEKRKKRVFVNLDKMFQSHARESFLSRRLSSKPVKERKSSFSPVNSNKRVSSVPRPKMSFNKTFNLVHSSSDSHLPFLQSIDGFFSKNIIEKDLLGSLQAKGASSQKATNFYKKKKKKRSQSNQPLLENRAIWQKGRYVWKEVPVKNLHYYKDLLPKTIHKGKSTSLRKIKALSCSNKAVCSKIKSGELGFYREESFKPQRSKLKYKSNGLLRKCSKEYTSSLNKTKKSSNSMKKHKNFKNNMKRKISSLLKPTYKDNLTEKMIKLDVVKKQRELGVFLYGQESNCYEKHKKMFFKVNTGIY